MSNEKLEVTTDIVLIDIVRYSLLNNEEQLKAVEVLHFDLITELNFIAGLAHLHTNEMMMDFVPTGDGLYIILDPKVCGCGIPLGISVRNYLLWFASHRKNHLYDGIRVAVHSGKALAFTGVKQCREYVGDGMNDCARLLSVDDVTATQFCGDTNYVIASEAAWLWFDRLFSHDRAKQFLSTIRFRMSTQFQILDKHLKRHNARLVEASRSALIQPIKLLRPFTTAF